VSSEMRYMPHELLTAYLHQDRIFKFVTRWGENINIDREYDEK